MTRCSSIRRSGFVMEAPELCALTFSMKMTMLKFTSQLGVHLHCEHLSASSLLWLLEPKSVAELRVPWLSRKLFPITLLSLLLTEIRLIIILTVRGSFAPRTCSSVRTVEMEQASSQPLQQTNSAPPFQLWCYQYPFLHHLWQRPSLCVQSRSCKISFVSRILCGLKLMPKIIAASSQLGNLFFRPVQI